jgi:thiol-disulfide isomerase/thioredoxin
MSSRSSFARSFDALSWKRLVDPQELTNASTLGALISLFGGALLLFLVAAETLSFFTPGLSTQVALDAYGGDKPLRMTVNITFPHVACNDIAIEVTDAVGSRNTNLSSSNIHRITIDSTTGRALMVKRDEGINTNKGKRGFLARLLGLGDAPSRRPQQAWGHPSMLDPSVQEFSTRLDYDSFPDFIRDNDVALVTFGAHWCPWSRKLAPIWEQVAEVVSTVPDIKLGRVDCASDGASQLLCLQHRIGAFPTILLFKGHSPRSYVHYHGERTQEALLAFLVAARQDETLTTDPANPNTLEAHAAAERLARDVQLLEHPDVEHGHDHGPRQAQEAAPAEGEKKPNGDPSALDPAHPGRAQALIEAIHAKGLHAPGDAARAFLQTIANAAKSGGKKDAGGGENAARALQNQKKAQAGQGGKPAAQSFGCQIAGSLDFRRVPTALVFYPNLEGRSADYSTLNFSTHIVHDLFFGPKLTNYQIKRLTAAAGGSSSTTTSSSSNSGNDAASALTGGSNTFSPSSLNRLKNTQFIGPSWNTSHEHYLSIVGSRFTFLSGHEVESYSYTSASASYEEHGSGEALEALNEHKKKMAAAITAATATAVNEAQQAQAGSNGSAPEAAAAPPAPPSTAVSDEETANALLHHVPHPQVKFSFQINPLALHTKEERQPFFKWLTSLLAIVGGTAVMLVLLDSLLHSLRGKASVKGRMNKLS